MKTRRADPGPTLHPRALGVAGLVLALALYGCATSGGGSEGDDSSYGSSDHIPSEELRDRLGPSVDLYQAVQRLRPQWLRPQRGVSTVPSGRTRDGRPRVRHEPVVYVDGSRFGEMRMLQELRVGDVEELRFIDGSDATTRYGTGHAGGVISVTSRSG